MGVPNLCLINARVEIVFPGRSLMPFVISSFPSLRERPPFIFSLAFTGVPKSRVLVGAGAVGASKVGGAFHASLLRPHRSLTPHFKLARRLAFSVGRRRSFNFIRCILPRDSSSAECIPSFVISRSPTPLAQPMRVASCIGLSVFRGAWGQFLPVLKDYWVRRSGSLCAGLS